MHRGRSGGGPFRQPSVSLYCLRSQVPCGPFGIIGPAGPKYDEGERVRKIPPGSRYDEGREGVKGGRREEGSHIERPRRASVVLFQVCIRFVFQPIILTRPSVSSLSLSLSLSLSVPAPRRSRVQRNTRRYPKTFPGDIKGEPSSQRWRDEVQGIEEEAR